MKKLHCQVPSLPEIRISTRFFFNVGPTNVGHLFDHLLWSIFQSVLVEYLCFIFYSMQHIFALPGHRDSGYDFVHFQVPFLEGRISDICAACDYPTRNANFKSRISDIPLKSVSFLVSQFLCRSQSYFTGKWTYTLYANACMTSFRQSKNV